MIRNMKIARRTEPAAFLLALLIAIVMIGCQPKEITSAKIYINNGEWERAFEQLKLAVETYPDNAEAHFLLGQAYGYRADFKNMLKQFELSLANSTKFEKEIQAEKEKYWIKKYNDGLSAQGKRDFGRAEELLKTAIFLEPERYEAYVKLAVNYLNIGRNDKAILIYQNLLQKEPDKTEYLRALANLYYSQKMYADAIALLKKILPHDPSNRDDLANLALAYDSLGDTSKALAAYKNAVIANPTDKDLIFLFGVHQYKSHHFRKAVRLFKRILKLDPQDFESISNIGNAYLSLAESYRKKLRNGQKGGLHTSEIPQLRQSIIDNYHKAIQYLEKALALKPNHPALWRNLGVAYINIGNKDKGEQAFHTSEKIAVEQQSHR